MEPKQFEDYEFEYNHHQKHGDEDIPATVALLCIAFCAGMVFAGIIAWVMS